VSGGSCVPVGISEIDDSFYIKKYTNIFGLPLFYRYKTENYFINPAKIVKKLDDEFTLNFIRSGLMLG
jgi:hypothetical protein